MTTSHGRALVLSALVAAAIAGAGCGGDDGDDSSEPAASGATATTQAASSSQEPTTDASSGTSPTYDAVLKCLTSAGIEAEDQSLEDVPDTLGIDYDGGRTIIKFGKDAEDAEITAMAAGAEGFQVGTIVVSPAQVPETLEDRPTIEGCLKG